MRPDNAPGGQEAGPSASTAGGEPDRRSFIERARRAQIIDAAASVIAEEGFGQASLARIARRAGVSKGVISYHFAGKNELIMQVVVAVYEAGGTEMGPVIEAAGPPRARLAAYLRSNLEFLAKNPTKVRALMEIFTSFRAEDGKLPFDATSDEPVLAPLLETFRAGQASGEFTDFDPMVMARTVRAAIDALPPQMSAYPDLDVAAYAEQLVALFDRATRSPSGSDTP